MLSYAGVRKHFCRTDYMSVDAVRKSAGFSRTHVEVMIKYIGIISKKIKDHSFFAPVSIAFLPVVY